MNYQTNYEKWLKYELLDAELKENLKSLTEKETEDAFYTDIAFGTGGIRGTMGPGTNRVNLYTIMRATLGFARFLQNNQGTSVAISYDNRYNSYRFAHRAAGVLAHLGFKVFLTKTLRPTPYLSYMVRHFKCDGGIMITASHNPKTDNGFKVYDSTGCQLVPHLAEQVIEAIDAIEDYFQIPFDEFSDQIHFVDESFDAIYLNEVKKIAIHTAIPKPLKLVYSPLHGTGGTLIPKFLESMGYSCYPYEKQMKVDPFFSATLSSNPEEKKAYEGALSYAKEINGDLVLLTDPDADRLGVMVLHEGIYHFLSGNQTASLTLNYILSQKEQNGTLPQNGYVFTTNVTTPLIEKIAKHFSQKVVTTLTGFKFIGEQAKLIESKGTYVFGCEESFGSLIKDFVRDKDAVQAVYMLAEMANYYHAQGKTLIDILDETYESFGYYYEETKNIALKGIEGKQKIEAIMNFFRQNRLSFKNKELIQIDDVLNQTSWKKTGVEHLDLPVSNVLKFYYRDGSWVVFRPSGTEPKLKIYFSVIGRTMAESKETMENYQIIVDGLLSQF